MAFAFCLLGMAVVCVAIVVILCALPPKPDHRVEVEEGTVTETINMEVEQAKDDRAFLLNQLERFDKLIAEANVNLRNAQRAVELDEWMEEHGKPIAEKVSTKHITERDRLVKLVIRYETQIHAAEKKLRKVEEIISRG